MDLFTQELGPSYVPAFAARLLVAMGHGIARRKNAFTALLDEDAEGMWTLALLVVRWHADVLPPAEAKLVAEALPDPEMAVILTSLNAFRERLVPFTTAAHKACTDAQLVGVGVYFVAAVDAIGLPMLSAAIKSGPVTELQVRLQARFPLPAEIKSRYAAALELPPKDAATEPAALPRPSRLDRFDRADRAQRSGRAVPQTTGVRVARAALPLCTPQLEGADVTRAYLHTLGWEPHEVDRLLAGPDGRKAG